MNTFGLMVCVIVCLCVIQTTMAGCSWGCWPSPFGGVMCGLRCTFKKRSVGGQPELPCNFERYDNNSDGDIAMGELESQLETYLKANAMKATFFMMDANDDEMVDREEFKFGPLYRENCI